MDFTALYRGAYIVGTPSAHVQIYEDDPGSEAGVTTYIRGLGLIASRDDSAVTYYHYDAHGDVVQTTTAWNAVKKDYFYDAFGVELDRDDTDDNPFRYCGEQFDSETGNYYLRARYYTPGTGRFTQEDTHWNSWNMVYGDEPQRWNEWQSWLDESDRDDPLGLHTYTYKPQQTAIAQAGNLYGYGLNNPLLYRDVNGEAISVALTGAAIEIGANAEAIYAVGALIVTTITTESVGSIKVRPAQGVVEIGEQITILTVDEVMPDINDAIIQYSPHRKVRKRTKNKHQEAESRRQRDHQGEKGDDRRPIDRGNKRRK